MVLGGQCRQGPLRNVGTLGDHNIDSYHTAARKKFDSERAKAGLFYSKLGLLLPPTVLHWRPRASSGAFKCHEFTAG